MIQDQIQLWTDETNTEFAIFLQNSHYLIRTNQIGKYTRMVDESPYMDVYTNDWKYTLSQWVSYRFGNHLRQNLHLSQNQSPQATDKDTKKKEEKKEKTGNTMRFTWIYNIFSGLKPQPELEPKLLKCQFCNLIYYD